MYWGCMNCHAYIYIYVHAFPVQALVRKCQQSGVGRCHVLGLYELPCIYIYMSTPSPSKLCRLLGRHRCPCHKGLMDAWLNVLKQPCKTMGSKRGCPKVSIYHTVMHIPVHVFSSPLMWNAIMVGFEKLKLLLMYFQNHAQKAKQIAQKGLAKRLFLFRCMCLCCMLQTPSKIWMPHWCLCLGSFCTQLH